MIATRRGRSRTKAVLATLLIAIALILPGCWPSDDSKQQPTWSNTDPPTPAPIVCMEWNGRDYIEVPCR